MLRVRFVAIASLMACLSCPVSAEPATPPDTTSSPTTQATPADSSAAKPTEVAATEPVATETPPAATDATAAPATEAAPAAASQPAPPAEIDPTLTVQIDLAEQSMVVSENGAVKYSWPISSGTASFPTPRGTYRPQWTAKMWYSRKYDWAPMPHAVFINGGVAVHATYHTGALGRPASHGCIRLAPANAKTFYNLVHRHGLKATKVSIYGTPKWRAPAVASRTVQKKRYAAAYQETQPGWFWGDWGNAGTSAYSPGFTGTKLKKKYAVPPAKFNAKKGVKLVKAPKPQASYDSW